MAGRWSPKKAREDAEEHQRLVDLEMAAMADDGPVSGPGSGPATGPAAGEA
jgi:hypothetical protein